MSIVQRCCVFLTLFFSLISFSQQLESKNSISAGPTNFKNTIQIKFDFEKQSSVTVDLINEPGNVVKSLTYENITQKSFKIDLSSLLFGKKYTIKAYNTERKVLFTKDIFKTLKYN